MFKFSIKFIVCLLLILFVNSVFAYDFDATMERIKNLQTPQEQYTELTKLIQNNHNLTQQQLMIIQQHLIIILHMIIQPTPKPTPTSIYFTGQDRVWNWHPSFEFITVTIGPRVRIHASPSIYASNAPYNPEWTEHRDCEVSIFNIVPGPGSVRGWGLLQTYRKSNNGWVNLDDCSILWRIKGEKDIRYWHYENGVETPEWPNAYCVKP